MPAIPVFLILRGVAAFFFALYGTIATLRRVIEVGLDPLELILVGTVLEATAFLTEIPTGVVADVYSRRLSILVGFAVMGLGFVLESLTLSFAGILLAQVVWGLGATFVSGAESAWIADEVGADRVGPIYLRGTQAAQGGTLAGIGVGAALGTMDLSLPLLVAGGGMLALAGGLVFVMPERGFTPTPSESRSSFGSLFTTFREGIGTVRQRPALVWILVIALLMGAASEAIDRLWELHFITHLAFPAAAVSLVIWFGALRAVGLGLSIGVTEWFRRRVDTTDTRRTLLALAWLTVGLVATLVVFGLATSFVVGATAYLLGGVARRLSSPLLDTWTNAHLEPQVRATVLSMRQQSDAFGQLAGGPALGVVAQSLGVRAALLAAAAVQAPTAAIYAGFVRRSTR